MLLNFVLVSGINVTMLLLFLLLKKKKRQLPHLILIALFIYFLFVSIDAFGGLYRSRALSLVGYLFADTIGYFAGPALLLYIQSIFYPQQKLITKQLYHFIPFFIYLSLVTIPSFVNSLLSTDFAYVEMLRSYPFIFNIQAFYLLGYLVLALYILRKHKTKLNAVYSNLDNKDLSWIMYLLIGFILTISFYILVGFYESITGQNIANAGIYTTIIMLFMIFFLGYYGLSQSKILLPDFILKSDNIPSPSHHLSNASTEEIENLKNNLFQVFTTHQPYLDPQLNLSQLAFLTVPHLKKLTALLNHHLQTSFYDLVNEKRIKAVKKRLDQGDYKNFTLMAIAQECGFNSKSSFNRVFKKECRYHS